MKLNKQRLIDKLNRDEAWRIKKERIVGHLWDTVPMVLVAGVCILFYWFMTTLED